MRPWLRRVIPADRYIRIWLAVTTSLAMTCAALIFAVIAISTSADAGRQAKGATDCINGILGARAATAAADNTAHIDFAKAVNDLFVPRAAAGQAAELAKFKASVAAYVKTLVADQAFRDAHPLGAC